MMSRRRKGNIWFLAGLLFLASALLLVLYNLWENDRAGKASQKVVVELEEKIEENAKSPVEGEAPQEREMPTVEIDGYRYIGYLDVPAAGLHLPVMEEWDYTRLKIAPCHFSGSVYNDNMVIAGHNYRKHFSPLRWQGIGTQIMFTDVDGNVYHYEISDIEILKPTQVDDLVRVSNDWDLTLFTCTIGGQTRHTIRCVRTDKE